MRAGDLVIACGLFAFTLPLMAIAALLIGCNGSATILDRHERIGFGGHHFEILRFRTSARDSQPGSSTWARPQRTRFGQFLWCTRIDCLPMLINVLRGDMTILGCVERPCLSGSLRS